MQPDYFTYLSNLCSDLIYNDAHKVYSIIDVVAFVLSFYDKGLITKDQRNLLIKQIYGDEFNIQSALNDIKIAKDIKTLRHSKNVYYIIRDLNDPNTTYLIADLKGDAPFQANFRRMHQVYLGNILVDKDRQAAFDLDIAQKALQKFHFGNFVIIPIFTRNILKQVRTDVGPAYIL